MEIGRQASDDLDWLGKLRPRTADPPPFHSFFCFLKLRQGRSEYGEGGNENYRHRR